MKLPIPSLSVAERMNEFDDWVTASLGEIRDTDKCQQTLEQTCVVMDLLDDATSGFQKIESCQPDNITDTLIARLKGKTTVDVQLTLEALFSVLYLVTGRSDNNGKCQFPLHLRDALGMSSLPDLKSGKLITRDIPRVLKVDAYSKWIAGLHSHTNEQKYLLRTFIDFVLSGPNSIDQLWALGNAYHSLKEIGKQEDLLAPLVVFQIRGSVSASGGHEPESLLRDEMTSWGLTPGIDFNTVDVGVSELLRKSGDQKGRKTRKYDFALPYRTEGWYPRILIQSQFYAGDSGSVSHKNVDQTSTSRRDAVERFEVEGYEAPIFIELVDGAGYFASLNGDLRHLLEFDDTRSFTQLKSAPIRLRRELQDLGFLTVLEIDHALLRAGMEKGGARKLLLDDGYGEVEIARQEHVFNEELPPERRQNARRYALLDLCVIHGRNLKGGEIAGSITVPGYGPAWGVKLDELSKSAQEEIPVLMEDWSKPSDFLADIRWLCESGFASLA